MNKGVESKVNTDSSEAQRPVPPVTEFNAPFVQAALSERLELAQCDECGSYVYPHGPVCTECFSSNLTWTALSGRGVVRTWVTFHKAYHPYYDDKLPYTCAFIELEEGPRVITNLLGVDPTDIFSEMPVVATYEKFAGVSVVQFMPESE